jgi:hypothetical protein
VCCFARKGEALVFVAVVIDVLILNKIKKERKKPSKQFVIMCAIATFS